MRLNVIRAVLPVSFLLLLIPLSASAATSTSFEISAWLPYWSAASSTADVIPHLNELTEIDPFVYSVTSTGGIYDNGPMNQPPWSTVVADAKADGVRVVPTVMWSDPGQMHTILSNTTTRIALEDRITALVMQNGYSGIDIDFEGLQAADSTYFSTFLEGLYLRLGATKWLMCDIPPRTPLSAEYYGTTPPTGAGQYAYNYTAINEYCDRVRLMAYDQQSVDLQLDDLAASSSQLYAPIADPAWVEAVVNLAEQSIAPSKIVVGIPTYGYEYQVTAYAGQQYDYNILWSFDPGYALQIEKQYNVSPTRAPWGEEELTYTPSGTSTPPVSTPQMALTASAAAALYANQFNSHLQFNYLVWPDATSTADKIDLAKALGVRGIAIFKIDGGEDPNIWTVLQGVKK